MFFEHRRVMRLKRHAKKRIRDFFKYRDNLNHFLLDETNL